MPASLRGSTSSQTSHTKQCPSSSRLSCNDCMIFDVTTVQPCLHHSAHGTRQGGGCHAPHLAATSDQQPQHRQGLRGGQRVAGFRATGGGGSSSSTGKSKGLMHVHGSGSLSGVLLCRVEIHNRGMPCRLCRAILRLGFRV